MCRLSNRFTFENESYFQNMSNLTVTLTGWDQSEKFVKIYITLKGVHKIPVENVKVTFTEK